MTRFLWKHSIGMGRIAMGGTSELRGSRRIYRRIQLRLPILNLITSHTPSGFIGSSALHLCRVGDFLCPLHRPVQHLADKRIPPLALAHHETFQQRDSRVMQKSCRLRVPIEQQGRRCLRFPFRNWSMGSRQKIGDAAASMAFLKTEEVRMVRPCGA